MDVQIKTNSEGTTSVKLDGKEMNDSITKLNLVIEPPSAPRLILEIVAENVSFEGDIRHFNIDSI